MRPPASLVTCQSAWISVKWLFLVVFNAQTLQPLAEPGPLLHLRECRKKTKTEALPWSARPSSRELQSKKMAHRLLIRRVWTLSVKDIRCLPSSAAAISSSSFSTSLQSPPSRVSLLSPPRTLPRTLHQISRREVSFNVQDNEDFTERVINSQLPVLVDFHAQWCGPCKILGPRLEKAVAKQKGRVAMAKVDIDEHTDLAIEYGVSAVPTVIAMRGGDVVDHFVGIKDDDELDSFVSKVIGQ
ncbi:hypothetical protein OJAV_G00074380 [Oryzias javanicus]|uniref:Thioredoxin, mitochondrial n=1 Tax=Oryzias javanicus TaxID=123683 RepID=A0A3S2PT08_ORYJA|nr:hypothetical protein OJAV_G00074380 [Oryzias javanicus]